MKLIILIFLIFTGFILSLNNETGKGKIVGEVIDQTTNQKIVGAVVEILNSDIYTTTNENGEFEISNLTPRTYALKVSAVYYLSTYRTDVRVTGGQSTKVIIELKLASYETEEVVVSAERFFDKPLFLTTSTNSLTSEEIRRAPGASEDLNRLVQSLPGVTTATDSRNDLIVRGGSPVENLIIVEGIEVPNINHFGTQGASGGPIGMINVDFLNDVTFSAGGFPAKFGDRLSSIMDVKYRNGDKKEFNTKLDLGIAGAGIVLEGPVQTEKSSFLFSARRSYLDLILSSTGLTAVPNYSNFNLKATYELSDNHKLSLIGLAGIDKIELKGFNSEDDPFIESTNYSGWQFAAGLVHKWLIGDNTFIQNSISTNQFQRNIISDSVGRKVFQNESLDTEYILKTDLSHRLSNTDLLEVGTSARYLRNDNSIFISERINFYGIFSAGLNVSTLAEAFKIGSYAQYSKKLFPGFEVTTGIRHDYFNYIEEKNTFSPRISTSFEILGNLNLNAAYGIYYQTPPLLWLISYEENKKLRPMKNQQVILGLEYFPAKDLKISVEVFDKKYSDYPNSVLIPQVTYSNAGAEYVTLGLEKLISAATGKARGIEFFIQKKLTNGIYGMLNYSYSDIKFKSLDGVERPSTFDYKNVLTAILGYKFMDNLEISFKYRFMGGRPYTPLNELASSQLNQIVYDYNQYNSIRHNNYQRLDLRVDYRTDLFGWNITTYIDFQNLFNTDNVEQIIWNQKKQKVDYIYQWKFLPAGGIKIEF